MSQGFFSDLELKQGAVNGNTVPVILSAKCARLEFNGCNPDYIRNVCHGRCCWVTGKSGPTTTIIVEKDQRGALKKRGAVIDEHSGVIQTVNGKCMFQSPETGLCSVHLSGEKPRSCFQSPWILTENDKLIIRNRYRMLRCFKAEPRLPAYRAFESGLRILFGEKEASRIIAHFDKGGGDLKAEMLRDRYLFNKEVHRTWHDNYYTFANLTPVEQHKGCWLKRDDLFTYGEANGGKARAMAVLLEGAEGGVTCGSRSSVQCMVAAKIGKVYGIPIRIHLPSGEDTDEIMIMRKYGAELVRHKAGYNNVIIARAREDAVATGFTLIPFGLATGRAVRLIAEQASNIPEKANRIVVCVGSGTTLAGVVTWVCENEKQIPIIGVVVGADPVARLDEFAPKGWKNMVKLVATNSGYHTASTCVAYDGVLLDPFYEAKCIPFLKAGDLFWISGHR